LRANWCLKYPIKVTDDVISEKEFCIAEDLVQTPKPPSTPNRMSGNIHLWQFVKELLNEPTLNSGIFHQTFKELNINDVILLVGIFQVASLGWIMTKEYLRLWIPSVWLNFGESVKIDQQ
jgi:hypothetical protein